MGLLYNLSLAKDSVIQGPIVWVYWLFLLIVVMALNEFARQKLWCSILLFIVVPIIFTIWILPVSSPMNNEWGTGNWFNYVKLYSALAGVWGFMALRFVKWTDKKTGEVVHLADKKWALCFPPLILAINIAEAVIRDFEIYGMHFWTGGEAAHLWVMSGPWNIMNGVAGIINIITICGWYGIFISKDEQKDMIWPDMLWFWIIAYDLWNFAYTYNAMTDHSAWTGLLLLTSCTIPAFWIKKGAWLQTRAQTLAIYCMFGLGAPWWSDHTCLIPVTRNYWAFFTLSFIALIFNIGVLIYQAKTIKQKKLNPLKDELYTDSMDYISVVKENR